MSESGVLLPAWYYEVLADPNDFLLLLQRQLGLKTFKQGDVKPAVLMKVTSFNLKTAHIIYTNVYAKFRNQRENISEKVDISFQMHTIVSVMKRYSESQESIDAVINLFRHYGWLHDQS